MQFLDLSAWKKSRWVVMPLKSSKHLTNMTIKKKKLFCKFFSLGDYQVLCEFFLLHCIHTFIPKKENIFVEDIYQA